MSWALDIASVNSSIENRLLQDSLFLDLNLTVEFQPDF